MQRFHRLRGWVLAAALVAPDAFAQAPDCGETAEMLLTCQLRADGAEARLTPSQAPAQGGCAQPQVATFAADEFERPRSIALAAGQTGDCRFAGGRTLRVRVAQEPTPLAGPCVADAAASFSLWLDGRKLASRRPVHGRCDPAPASWAYRLAGDALYDCSGGPCKPSGDPARPLAALPVDAIEYPAADAPSPRPGSLQRLLDRDPVCAAAERRLAASWNAFDPYVRDDDGDGAIRRLSAADGAASAALPDGLQFAYGGASAHEFDFDNDGRIDRVYAGDSGGQGGWYYSPLLVVAGVSAEGFRAGDAISAVPCQWDRARPPLSQCDDLRGATKDARAPTRPTPTQAVPAPLPGIEGGDAFFRTRYTATLALRFAGATYVALSGRGAPSRDYVGLYRPGPGGAHEAVCLIRRVPANM